MPENSRFLCNSYTKFFAQIQNRSDILSLVTKMWAFMLLYVFNFLKFSISSIYFEIIPKSCNFFDWMIKSSCWSSIRNCSLSFTTFYHFSKMESNTRATHSLYSYKAYFLSFISNIYFADKTKIKF